jgi:hypothetical protein
MSETFEQAMALQCAIMMTEARRIDMRGYAILRCGLNQDATNNQRIYSYLSGAFEQFLGDWDIANKKRHVLIFLRTPKDNTINFHFRVPTVKSHRPLLAALEIMAMKVSRSESWTKPRGAVLTVLAMSNQCQFRGFSADALKTVLNILDMPQHRAILTGD